MTYLDVLMLAQERGEHFLNQDSDSLITNKHRYFRQEDNGEWMEDKEPGAPEARWGRGGQYYAWKTATTE